MRRFSSRIVGLAILGCGLLPYSQAQTFIRAILPNPSAEPATGYNFQILTPGVVQDAVLQSNVSSARTTQSGNSMLEPVSYNVRSNVSQPASLIKPMRASDSAVRFAFKDQLPADGSVDLRISFSPKDYWKVYFNDTFQYKDGHTARSHIPYAAFFINFTPTKDPAKVMASLTVINNIASTYGIPSSVVNDEDRPTINFRHAVVYINNSMKTYTLASFDHPDGRRMDLPESFSLKKGQAQVFDLGLVDKDSYIYTQSEVSYEGSGESYPIACAHSPQDIDNLGSVVNPEEDSVIGAVSKGTSNKNPDHTSTKESNSPSVDRNTELKDDEKKGSEAPIKKEPEITSPIGAQSK